MSAPLPPLAPATSLDMTRAEKTFDSGTQALRPVDLSIAAGEFVALLGPSGCGKSTLLRLIAGLEQTTSGSVKLSTESTTTEIAYVFQDAHLLPWRTAGRNVELPLELAGLVKSRRQASAKDALVSVGLDDAADRYPAQLSGGMRMRVSLARALVTRPSLLLLDEPFAALDELTRQQLDDLLRRRWQRDGMTVVFVTHSVAEAVYLADRAIVLSARPGKVIYDRPIDLPADRPAALRTSAEFARQLQPLHAALAGGGDL